MHFFPLFIFSSIIVDFKFSIILKINFSLIQLINHFEKFIAKIKKLIPPKHLHNRWREEKNLVPLLYNHPYEFMNKERKKEFRRRRRTVNINRPEAMAKVQTAGNIHTLQAAKN